MIGLRRKLILKLYELKIIHKTLFVLFGGVKVFMFYCCCVLTIILEKLSVEMLLHKLLLILLLLFISEMVILFHFLFLFIQSCNVLGCAITIMLQHSSVHFWVLPKHSW